MTRSDRWTGRVLAFLAGVVLTAIIGGWAVPKVHAALEDDVRIGALVDHSLPTPEKPSVSHWLRRCTHAVEGLSEDLEGVQVPRYTEGP